MKKASYFQRERLFLNVKKRLTFLFNQKNMKNIFLDNIFHEIKWSKNKKILN